MIADFCSLVKANRGRENRGKEKRINTRKNYGSEVNSIARRGQGGIPLAGSRDSVPCGAWGNAPTVGRLTYSKGKVKHGTLVAGSEASLRTNSRSRRSGIPHPRKKSTMVVCAAKGSRGRPQTSSVSIAPLSPPQRRNPLLAEKTGYGRKSCNPVAPIWRDNVALRDRAAWGRSCGSAELLAGTLRCLRLCGRLP